VGGKQTAAKEAHVDLKRILTRILMCVLKERNELLTAIKTPPSLEKLLVRKDLWQCYSAAV
jgi:hypothetical protein